MATFQINVFDCQKEKKHWNLVAEMSTLEHLVPPGGQVFEQMTRNYRGFSVQGAIMKLDFILMEVRKDREGEISSWELIPTQHSIAKYPAACNFSITILND